MLFSQNWGTKSGQLLFSQLPICLYIAFWGCWKIIDSDQMFFFVCACENWQDHPYIVLLIFTEKERVLCLTNIMVLLTLFLLGSFHIQVMHSLFISEMIVYTICILGIFDGICTREKWNPRNESRQPGVSNSKLDILSSTAIPRIHAAVPKPVPSIKVVKIESGNSPNLFWILSREFHRRCAHLHFRTKNDTIFTYKQCRAPLLVFQMKMGVKLPGSGSLFKKGWNQWNPFQISHLKSI